MDLKTTQDCPLSVGFMDDIYDYFEAINLEFVRPEEKLHEYFSIKKSGVFQ